jgi:hypothetical protein
VILIVGYEEALGSGLEHKGDKVLKKLRVDWVKYSRSCETRSTTGPLEPGRHVTEIPEFREKCFGRNQREEVVIFAKPEVMKR